MIFKIRRASDSYKDPVKRIEINTLEDLKKIDDDSLNFGLIINFCQCPDGDDGRIIIYDDYVE